MPLKVNPPTSTPSPRSLGPVQPRGRSGSESSIGSKSRTPYVSPSLAVAKKSKSSSKSKSVKSENSDAGEIIEVDNFDSPLCRSQLWNADKCPCNRSINSWLIDCSKCKQYWHTECVTLDGLNEKDINKLLRWLCPLCYTAPISTTDHMVIDVASSCMSCCNTRTLRDANQQFEVSAAASNLKSLSNICTAAASQDMNKCSEILRDFDFDDFRKRLDTLSQFDSHLKHVLLHENSLKGLDSEIKKLTDLLSSLSPTLQSQDHVHDSPSHR